MEWISVEDRLPDDGDHVDVYTSDAERLADVEFKRGWFNEYVFDYEGDFSHMEKINDVTHWMSIKPPKK